GDPRAAPLLTAMLGTATRWELRDAAAAALVDLGAPAMEAVDVRLSALPDAAVAHYAGALDVADRLGDLIVRAAGGEAAPDRLVRRACDAGVRARLEEIAQGGAGGPRTYARGVLA